MGSSRTAEITVGALFVLGVLALFALAMNVSNISSFSADKGFNVTAKFGNVGGLKTKAKVTLSGVTVGRVTEIFYDKKSFRATVVMAIDPQYDYLPEDTQASIYTAGLLGEQYVSLEPGAEEVSLKEGSVIQLTQSAVVLEEIIGKVLVSLTTK
ncbi:outer membrane lipid asymmetry maintenance protein MlaD [uncultured Cocleimonas sp.]|uniref:outer membrane lipid asymmetry maintenance protein MlaD n=1 Tax=uncultured Cocleimonas sp. TaxID=1051587 RepID=UPI002636165C|nr:outer membrane lipid asymmetry maintenance protein MlaD [uncultured Cocleimonas sp.]